MDDLQHFKEFLGPLAAAYTDAQLEQLRRDFDIAADLLIDLFLEDRAAKRRAASSHRAIDSLEREDTIKGSGECR